MSGGIPESVVEEVKAQTDLADLVASYGVDVRVAGASRKACCPFHREKTPSFSIDVAKGLYHCFGCGESGDAIKFVQKMDGLSFVEAVKRLAGRCGVRVEEKEDPEAGRRRRLYALLAELAQFYHRCLLQTREGAPARKYLESRAISGEVQAEYLLGYAPKGAANILKWAERHGYAQDEMELAGVIAGGNGSGDHGYHRFGGRIVFSIRDRQGRVVGFSGRQLVASKNSGKYVNSPETPVFSKKRVLYGFDKAMRAIALDRPRHEAIVCEGQIDCIRLQTRGFPNAVAGQGTAFTEEHVAMLGKVAESVVLVYDDDEAGHKATVKAARLCLAAGLPVRVVALPDGDDPDSFLRTHPSDDFRRLIDAAESIMSFQVRAERSKERDPMSLDAVARVTREVLATIAACPNAVLKAAMIGEAAKLLSLPMSALSDELGKVVAAGEKAQGRFRAMSAAVGGGEGDGAEAEAGQGDVEDPPPASEDASEATPLPAKERAFCSFLLANEYDATLSGMVGDLLPPSVLTHPLAVRVLETWRQECACGKDLFAAFADALSPRERRQFDAMWSEANRSQASALTSVDILEDFVRSLWADSLRRRRGTLPADGGADAAAERLRISADIKRVASVKWRTAKEIVRGYMPH